MRINRKEDWTELHIFQHISRQYLKLPVHNPLLLLSIIWRKINPVQSVLSLLSQHLSPIIPRGLFYGPMGKLASQFSISPLQLYISLSWACVFGLEWVQVGTCPVAGSYRAPCCTRPGLRRGSGGWWCCSSPPPPAWSASSAHNLSSGTRSRTPAPGYSCRWSTEGGNDRKDNEICGRE